MQKDKMIQVGILVITFILCGCLYSCQDSQKTKVLVEEKTVSKEQSNTNTDKSEAIDTKQEDKKIVVYLCGEVKSPGVYEVDEGSRLYQVVELAGGILETASPNYLNLAECVTDGQKIVVPSVEEANELEQAQTESSSGLVNLNTANEDTLTTLPGIGPSKAKSIISYRESKGSFQSVEELMEIEGIKEGVFNKVKDMITVK
jgi:competence protein ComEA